MLIAALALADAHRGVSLVAVHDLAGFHVVSERAGERVLESKGVGPGFDWNELVVSWNAEDRARTGLVVEVRARGEGFESKFYTMARWSADRAEPRESVKGQKDADGDVDTDTLKLRQPGRDVDVRITLRAEPPRAQPKIDLLTLCFADRRASPPPLEPFKEAWGKVIEAPRRSQMSYPGGNVLCSPTAVSMILAHWAEVLDRPMLDRDVPEVQAGVFDPKWPGTGNWPFNTAFAGSQPGMRAYVARLTDIAELEAWTAAGFPVATSVSYDLLRGKGKKGSNDGHLVVLVGFTEQGDPVFNDPGKGTEVRQTYQRAHFDAAWASSGRTVYLIYPRYMVPPDDPFGHWVP
ncbi:MAG: peptidase C39 family protein [Fimbriimonadaceae bacterium]|nr:peptidase C39 family protein [Fimbriimonadaceae bacterium]